jgi:hypothetical protein
MTLGDHLGTASNLVNPSPPLNQVSQVSQVSQDTPPIRWSEIAIDLLQGLTRSHQWESLVLPVTRLSPVPPWQRQADGLAIATLPLTLYFHDDLNRQRQTLTQLCAALAIEPLSTAWVLSFAYVIAQAVKGQLDPATVIPQTLAYLRVAVTDVNATADSVIALLEQVTVAQEHMTTLELLTRDIENINAIAIALLCFLQTPADMRLAMTRATRFCAAAHHPDAPTIHALLGALVGAHTGVAGIPPSWQTMPAIAPQVPMLMTLAESLVASWSGMSGDAIAASVPVAAPWVIRA